MCASSSPRNRPVRLVNSSLTVIGYPKPARANASHALASYIQTRRSARNRRLPAPGRMAGTLERQILS
jgi:hypothetical protein